MQLYSNDKIGRRQTGLQEGLSWDLILVSEAGCKARFGKERQKMHNCSHADFFIRWACMPRGRLGGG